MIKLFLFHFRALKLLSKHLPFCALRTPGKAVKKKNVKRRKERHSVKCIPLRRPNNMKMLRRKHSWMPGWLMSNPSTKTDANCFSTFCIILLTDEQSENILPRTNRSRCHTRRERKTWTILSDFAVRSIRLGCSLLLWRFLALDPGPGVCLGGGCMVSSVPVWLLSWLSGSLNSPKTTPQVTLKV